MTYFIFFSVTVFTSKISPDTSNFPLESYITDEGTAVEGLVLL